jgi:hypothetical protein
MVAQIPAEGISLLHDFKTSKFYKVSCACGNTDDDITLSIEVDDDTHAIMTHFWATARLPWWKEVWKKNYESSDTALYVVDLVNGVWFRITQTWKLWVHGYLEYESTTIMTEQQTTNFAIALLSAVAEVSNEHKKEQLPL